MVLESVVSALLSKYLGDYVDGLSTDNLSLGIFSGEVVLENLALKRSALAGLNLPITVKAGYLGPWRILPHLEAHLMLCRQADA